MDAELERYLSAVVILLSLNVGFLATYLWVSAVSVSISFLVVPPAIGAAIAGGVVWWVSGVLVR